MDIYQLQKKRRTHRKYHDTEVDYPVLERMVDHARLTASAMNLQPVVYKIVTSKQLVDEIFTYVSWAGSLMGRYKPTFDQRPRAYILLMYDHTIYRDPKRDIGAASYALQLMATHEGLGTCWMGAIDREKINRACAIDTKKYTLDTLLAIGYPADSPEVVDADDDIKYYLDGNNEIKVPKRSLNDILLGD